MDEILAEFSPSVSKASEVLKPGGRVKVRKRGDALGVLRKLFSEKKKPYLPNCLTPSNVSVSGSSAKTLQINCSGCRHGSDLGDGNCRLNCARILAREACQNLVLDSGFYKKEYFEKDTQKLKKLFAISDSLSLRFPEECGLCAKEHEAQVEKLKEAIVKDPLNLINGGVEVSENEEMTVSGVKSDVCNDCRKGAEAAVEKALRGIGECGLSKGYAFSPLVRPFFSNARVLFEMPKKNKIEESYESFGSRVVLSRGEEETYTIFPPEYKLGKSQLEAIKIAHAAILKKAGSVDGKQFEPLCRSEIISAAAKLGYSFSDEDRRLMTENLVRCTLGLDVIELLLRDPNLQDVYINSPIDTTPVYVKHKDYDDCRTNVYLSEQTARNIISKFRLRSGRAFSEVSPILDMELPEFGVRVNITGPPISPDGLAFAFRRASEEPWTLLRFIENRMISPLAAGLLGLMVNEESTVLMCGDRGSGKTSMLSALIGAMPVKYRILTIEDTFEIPVPALAEEGFRIQRMRVRPPTAGDSFELGTEEAMRSLLRMGDSAIVMGEVRGSEAKTLYEAMNVGGSGNCVLGTIHGKSPRSLLERVVFSLGVPPQSFKATDLVVIADRIKSGEKRLRRVSEIVEVKKSWKEPEAEKVFSPLMDYDREHDSLALCENLRKPEKSEVICKIANKRGVKPSSILSDIEARAEAYGYAVSLFRKTGDRKLLSLKTMASLNQKYLQLLSLQERKKPDYGEVLKGAKGLLDSLAGTSRAVTISARIEKNGNIRNTLQEPWANV